MSERAARGRHVGAQRRPARHRGRRDHQRRGDQLKVVVIFDTAGFDGCLPLSGAAARTRHLNEALASLGDQVTLLLCDLNPDSRPGASWQMPVHYLPYEQLYADTDALRARLVELAPDIVVMSNTQLLVRAGRALADAAGAHLVYEMHDDEAMLTASLDGVGDASREAGDLQTGAIQLADAIVVFTGRDARVARRLRRTPDQPVARRVGCERGLSDSGLRDRGVYVLPCGVDLRAEPATPDGQPVADRNAASAPPRRVVFLGNLYYEPNLRALTFLREVLAPRLAGTGCVIDVIGRYPSSLRLPCPATPRPGDTPVRMLGPVPDPHAALRGAAVAVAPLDSGGGMKCKTLEYMAAGVPIVATSEAVVGFPDPHRFALVSTQPGMADFPQLVRALLHDEAHAQRLGEAGRRLIAAGYSWTAIAERARVVYRDVRRRPRLPRPTPSERQIDLATRQPYWLREWRARRHGNGDTAHA